MKIGYIRASTKAQNIDRQIDELNAIGCERLFIDRITGTKKERPELMKMFDILREGDLVVVTELSRFGRSLRDLLDLVNELGAMRVDFQSLKENLDTSSPAGRLMFHVSAAFAEFEREIIVVRTYEGLSAARARGRCGGRPKTDSRKIEAASKMYNCGEFTVEQIAKICGISKSTVYRYVGTHDPPKG